MRGIEFVIENLITKQMSSPGRSTADFYQIVFQNTTSKQMILEVERQKTYVNFSMRSV